MKTIHYFLLITLLSLGQKSLYAEDKPILNAVKPQTANPSSETAMLTDTDFISIRNPFFAETRAQETPIPVTITPVSNQAIPIITTAPDSQNLPSPPALKVKKDVKPQILKIPTLTISGLVWNTDKPQAIINNKIVSVGDTIEEAKIIRITRAGITLNYHGKEITIILEK